jgi:cyanophycin synthetase
MFEVRLAGDACPERQGESWDATFARLKDWIGAGLDRLPVEPAERTRIWYRIQDATDPAELFARLALEFQRLAGTPVDQIYIESDAQPGECVVAIEFSEEAVGRLAIDFAERLVWPDAVAMPDFAECCQQLRGCAKEAGFGTTTAPIVAAARARGIPVTRLDGDCLLQLGYGARQRRVQGVITGTTGYLSESISRDKVLTKKLMQQLGLPTAEGRLVRDPDDAWAAACEIGLPVVVKPRDADYANGVSVHLMTKQQVVAGWELARQFRSDVLVERHLAGVPHRLLIVNDELVAAVRRDPAHVIADGRQTMQELIAEANRDPRRGDGPEFPWYPILIDEQLLQVVAQQGWHLDSVPPAGKFVTLQYDPKTCYAEMIRDVTESVHPDVAAAARDAVRMTGLDVAGVDVMASDITKPLVEQGGGILEVNAGPAIYLHRYPACNPPRPVPEAVLASLIPAGETGIIPIVAVLGDGRATTAAERIADQLASTGCSVGWSSATGIRIAGRHVNTTPNNNSTGCRALLLNPRVETAVCELSAASIRETGLPFDQCQAAVLVGGTVPSNAPLSAIAMEKCRRVLVDAVSPTGHVVINAEDLILSAEFTPGQERVVAVARSEHVEFLRHHAQQGGPCVFEEDGDAVIANGGAPIERLRLEGVANDPDAVLPQLLAIAAAWAVNRVSGETVVPGVITPPTRAVAYKRQLATPPLTKGG